MIRLLTLALLLVSFLASSASAATWVVRTASDSGGVCPGTTCTLRAAGAAASNGDTLTFDGDYTIALTATIVLQRDLTIDGTGHAVVVSGGNAHGILKKTDGSLTVRELTFVDSRVPPTSAPATQGSASVRPAS